jgi:hypothetical protein
VTEALKTSQFINLDLFGQAAAPGQEGKVSQQVYNRVQIQWKIRSAKINSQLRAYFPSTDLGQSWHRYSEVVTKAYQLVARLHDDRSGHLRDIRKYLGSGGSAIKWDALKDDTPTSEYATAFQAEYGKLITVMFARKDKIIQDVLDANAAGFDTSLWP